MHRQSHPQTHQNIFPLPLASSSASFSGRTDAALEWRKLEAGLAVEATAAKIPEDGKELKIYAVKPEDAALYTCTARDGDGKEIGSASTAVIVSHNRPTRSRHLSRTWE